MAPKRHRPREEEQQLNDFEEAAFSVPPLHVIGRKAKRCKGGSQRSKKELGAPFDFEQYGALWRSAQSVGQAVAQGPSMRLGKRPG